VQLLAGVPLWHTPHRGFPDPVYKYK